MGKVIRISEGQLKKIIKENSGTYMVLSNLVNLKNNIEKILSFKHHPDFDKLITGEHAWAGDHITTSKDDIEEVTNFMVGYYEEKNLSESEMEIDESKNKPTNPKLWASCLAWARSKYKVCPSAYCNGAAAKRYKSKGGGWRKSTNESLSESKKTDQEVYHKTYTSAINSALDYAENRGYEYDKEEVSQEIGLGPKKPKDGDTNKFSISLTKDGKKQKKYLNIQVYGMGDKYELNCYIN